MKRYERHLEQTKGRKFLEKVFGRQYQRYSTPELAAFLHLFTYRRLNYEERHAKNRSFRSLNDIWQHGGNCEEKTVFLTSLLQPVKGISCRFISVKRDGGHHLLLQLQFPHSEKRQTLSELASFYRESERYSDGKVSFHYEGGDQPWLMADPEMSGYIGDVSTLESKGYLTTDGSSWEWMYPEEATYISV